MSPPIYDFCGQEGSQDAMSDSKCSLEVFQHAFQGVRDIPDISVVLKVSVQKASRVLF